MTNRARNYEEGLSALEVLMSWLAENHESNDWNEASTRFQIIDRILGEVLGWPYEDIEVEVHVDRKFSDYEIGHQYPSLLVEAKREGSVFELPVGFERDVVSISTFDTLSPNVKEAVRQAMDYAQQRGIPLAVATNGHQYILFLASRIDGVPPESGRAIVFSSLDDVKARFKDFWNCLSHDGVRSFRASGLLQDAAALPKPEKLSAHIHDYPGFKNRNPVATEFQILGGLFIEDITRQSEIEPDFLLNCFLSSGSLPQYSLISREILTSRYSIYFEKQGEVSAEHVQTKEGVNPSLLQDALVASLSDRPILLVGDVGSGKSIFIRHLIVIDAADVLRSAIVLYIDFGRQPALATDLQKYVHREFVRQLDDNYGIDIHDRSLIMGVYHGQLIKFKNGPAGLLKGVDDREYARREVEFLDSLVENEEAHLRAVIRHLLTGRNQQTVVFLDNIDQRPSTFQEDVFLIGQSLAATWDATAFISLRPETFYSSKVSGSLSGYQPRVFTVSPPRVDRVVLKRLQFAEQYLEQTGRLSILPGGVTFHSEKLASYIRMLIRAFTDNTAIIEFVENMSGGNVRTALDFLVSFIGSGHVDSQKILDIGSGYVLPIHEFVRAVIYGDNEHFNPEISRIPNLFDIASDDGREHFLLPIFLAYVQRIGSSGAQSGYVAIEDVYAFLQSLGFFPRQIIHALTRSMRKGLVDPHPRADFMYDEIQSEDVEGVQQVRVTSAGVYAIERLAGMFQYVDAMIVDTPIVSPEYRAKIHDVRAIADRLNRADIFIEYLDDNWRALSVSEMYFDWPARKQQLQSDIDGARRRISQTS
jgi:hypothetical protein